MLAGLIILNIAIRVTDGTDPGNDGAGGGAAIMVLGFFALALIYIATGIQWLTTRKKQEPRGFPVEPMKGPDEEK